MAHHLDPNFEKPQKSIEKLINKIAPFLDSLNKVIKMSGSENMSENKSSISKTEKNLSSFYKNLNSDVFKTFVKDSQCKMLNQKDLTLKMRELLGLGRLNGCIGDPQWALLEKIIEKYFDSEIINREKCENWSNSALSHKILNLINYELIEYEFIEIIYILFIKKLPSTKENEENKKKYQNVVQDLYEAKKEHDKIVEKRKDFNNEIRYIHSEKAKKRQVMKEKRRVM